MAEKQKYVVLQVTLKEKFIGTNSKNLGELENVINWIAGLDEANVEGIDPLISVCDHSLPKRTDTIKMENTREEILKNAPAIDDEGEFFTVPKIIE
jgi:aspartyl-tRNA(Asn)/glutamyl-tRNA(Gln) amidotransferase subunit C